MLSAKFVGSRGIQPIESANVCAPQWVLTMEIPGVPYSEPAFSSIRPRTELEAMPVDGSREKPPTKRPDVVGVAYLITADQYQKLIGSEGGGIAYEDVEVVGKPLSAVDEAKTGPRISMRTLTALLSRFPEPAPSERYMVGALRLCNV